MLCLYFQRRIGFIYYAGQLRLNGNVALSNRICFCKRSFTLIQDERNTCEINRLNKLKYISNYTEALELKKQVIEKLHKDKDFLSIPWALDAIKVLQQHAVQLSACEYRRLLLLVSKASRGVGIEVVENLLCSLRCLPGYEPQSIDYMAHVSAIKYCNSLQDAAAMTLRYVNEVGNSDLLVSSILLILQGFKQQCESSKAFEFVESLKKHGVIADVQIWNALLEVLIAAPDDVKLNHLYEAFLENNLLENVEICEKFARLCIFARNKKIGAYVIEKFKRLNGEAQVFRTSKAELLLQWMILTEVSVDEIQEAMNIFFNHGLEPTAKLLQELLQVAILVNSNLYKYIETLHDVYRIERNSIVCALNMKYEALQIEISAACDVFTAVKDNAARNKSDIERNFLNVIKSPFEVNVSVLTDIVRMVLQTEITVGVQDIEALIAKCLKLDFRDMSPILHELRLYPRHRDVLFEKLFSEALNRNNALEKSWKAYLALNDMYSTIPAIGRETLIKVFCDRKQVSKALQIFKDTQHSNIGTNGTMYVDLLHCIAEMRNDEGLKYVHTSMKVDPRLAPNLNVYNALMRAYRSCELNAKVRDIWRQLILNGLCPNNSSVTIVLDSCRSHWWELHEGIKIWNSIRMLSITPNEENFNSLIGLLCRFQQWDSALLQAQSMEGFDIKPSCDLLLGLIRKFPKGKRHDVEKWVKSRHPDVLASVGCLEKPVM